MSAKIGIVNVLKPPGMTSMQVVKFLKKNLATGKAGHTGTLDPLAAGVLPICVGKATKVISFLCEDIKVYRGELILGRETNTHDREGEIVNKNNRWQSLNRKEIRNKFSRFIGDSKQIPPMYSAVHHKGKRLYELARDGKEVKRAAREISISSLEIVDINLPRIKFSVQCSRGTYIRSLVRDLGRELNTGAFLSFLLRTRSGPFKLQQSYIIEDIRNMAADGDFSFLKSPADPLSYPSAVIKMKAYKKTVNGAYLYPDDLEHYPSDLNEGDKVLLYDKDEQFLAIGSYTTDDTGFQLHPEKVFVSTLN